MPSYLGQTVDQSFLDMITTVYKGGYVAMHPLHTPPVESDATLISQMEAASVRGGPDADLLARSPFFVRPPAAAYAGLVKADDAIAHWPLDETTGTTAVDVIGGKNGTISGGVTLGQVGALMGGKAMAFAGNGSMITTAAVTIPAAFTVEAWFYAPAAPTATFTIFSTRTTGLAGQLQLVMNTSRQVYVWFSPGATTITPQLALNVWHYYAFVYNGTNVTAYINGQALAPVTVAHGLRTDPVRIGNDQLDGAAGSWIGLLDEIAIYSTALTPAQVKAHYDARIPRTVY